MYSLPFFDVDEDIIKIHYHKNVKFLYQNLIDIALKYGRCVSQSKRYNLVLDMVITASKSCFLLIAFFDSHLMVGIGEIELEKMLSPI